MASLGGGMWAPAALRVLRHAIGGSTAKISKVLRSKLGGVVATGRATTTLQPVAIRHHGSSAQPIHPSALLRQQKRGSLRWHSNSSSSNAAALRNTLRRFLSGTCANSAAPRRVDRAQFLNWNTTRAVLQHTGRAPFASSLRPNLTGGALPRTAGGYSVPGSGRLGGARYFSHTPCAQAQVVHNVSQALRAFWLSGQRARFDGCGPDGQKRYRAVGALEDEASRRLAGAAFAFPARRVPGSYVDFPVGPTITALSSPLAAGTGISPASSHSPATTTLNEDGLLDLLAADFDRALRDLTAVRRDLRRLAELGDLPVLLPSRDSATIRVRFPGLDADTVMRLCDDLDVEMGIVGQDEDFVEDEEAEQQNHQQQKHSLMLSSETGPAVALRFPFAPVDGYGGKALSSPGGSLRSHGSELSSALEGDDDDSFVHQFMEENPWLVSSEGTEAGHGSFAPSSAGPRWRQHQQQQQQYVGEGFEGLEGIYRFIQECDRATGRV